MNLNVDMFGLIALHRVRSLPFQWVLAIPNEHIPTRRLPIQAHHPVMIIPEGIVVFQTGSLLLHTCENTSHDRFHIVDLDDFEFSIDMGVSQSGQPDPLSVLPTISSLIDGPLYSQSDEILNGSASIFTKSRGTLSNGILSVLSYNQRIVEGKLHTLFTFKSPSGGTWGPSLVPDSLRYSAEIQPGQTVVISFNEVGSTTEAFRIGVEPNSQEASVLVVHMPVFNINGNNHLHGLFELMSLNDQSPGVGIRLLPDSSEEDASTPDPPPSIKDQIHPCVQDIFFVALRERIPTNRLSCPLIQIP